MCFQDTTLSLLWNDLGLLLDNWVSERVARPTTDQCAALARQVRVTLVKAERQHGLRAYLCILRPIYLISLSGIVAKLVCQFGQSCPIPMLVLQILHFLGR